jgi:hypothetical protein
VALRFAPALRNECRFHPECDRLAVLALALIKRNYDILLDGMRREEDVTQPFLRISPSNGLEVNRYKSRVRQRFLDRIGGRAV